MLNNAVIMGRLTDTPELRLTSNGNSVTSFTVAVDRNYVKAGEERQTDFIDVVVWGKTAEFVCSYFGKGSMIAIQGHIQTRNYDDKNGNRRKAVELVAENVSFCGGKEQGGQATGGYTQHAAEPELKEIPVDDISEPGNLSRLTEDDLPF